MKRFTEQFSKTSKQVKLTASERADLRDRLTTYMEYHPLPANMRQQKSAPVRSFSVAQVSHLFMDSHVRSVFIRSAVPTLAVIMMVVVPVLAEKSAPGDVLYPVKVRFNEEVRSQLVSSPYEAIEWEAERIERRIAEARLLASEGKLTAELEAEVAEAVKEQTQKTKTKIAELKTSDADEGAIAEITLASALEVQTEMLEADVARNASTGEEAGNVLASVVAEESSVATAEQEQANPSYDKLFARIETETTHAHELFDSIKPGAAAEEVTNIEDRLAMIAEKVSAAQELAVAPVEEVVEETTEEESLPVSDGGETTVMTLATVDVSTSTEEAASSTEEVVLEEEVVAEEVTEVDNKASAAMLLREALTDIRKLISFMTDIDVRANVKIEDLVPVEESVDEPAPIDEAGEKEVEEVSVEEDSATSTPEVS